MSQMPGDCPGGWVVLELTGTLLGKNNKKLSFEAFNFICFWRGSRSHEWGGVWGVLKLVGSNILELFS